MAVKKYAPFSFIEDFACDLLGAMSGENLVVNPELTCRERQAALSQLVESKKSGYDSCIVTRDGTYVTKKLYP